MKNLLTMKAVEHFVFVIVVAFAAQVTIGGAPLDLFSAAGRSAALTGIGMAIWRALREIGPTAGA